MTINRQIPIIVLLAASFLLGIFLVWPTYQKFSALRKNVEVKRIELKNREEYFANLRRLQVELLRYPNAVARMEAAIPDEPALPALYDILQQFSSNSGLILESLSSELKETSSGKFRPIEVTMKASGSYEALKDFISRTLRSSRILEIQSITFEREKSSEQEDQFLFDITIKLHAYSY